MTRPLKLCGYEFSVYNRIARVALHEKGVAYEREEVDPFAAEMPADYLKRHPFGRVPVLRHGAFEIYETSAITRYIDAAFEGPSLLPVGAEPQTRVAQVVSIIDNYGYHPMIRQVFSHRVFRPAVGEIGEDIEVAAGMTASRSVLTALNSIAAEGQVLNGRHFTLADCHLAPMMAYFIQSPEAADAVGNFSELSNWWASVSRRKSIEMTDPGLPLG